MNEPIGNVSVAVLRDRSKTDELWMAEEGERVRCKVGIDVPQSFSQCSLFTASHDVGDEVVETLNCLLAPVEMV